MNNNNNNNNQLSAVPLPLPRAVNAPPHCGLFFFFFTLFYDYEK